MGAPLDVPCDSLVVPAVDDVATADTGVVRLFVALWAPLVQALTTRVSVTPATTKISERGRDTSPVCLTMNEAA